MNVADSKTVVVNGAEHLNDNEMRSLFYRFGNVLGVKRGEDVSSGVQVELETDQNAQEAVKTLDDSFIEHDKKITVRLLSESRSSTTHPSNAARSGGN
jgi:hypothetical protein